MKNQITYTKQGYYLPNLKLPEQCSRPIGIWGQRHKNYLLHYHKIRYYNLLTSGKFIEYLANMNEQAEKLYEKLVEQLAEQEGITEQLKNENQILWVQKMNNICNRVKEIVNNTLIYN